MASAMISFELGTLSVYMVRVNQWKRSHKSEYRYSIIDTHHSDKPLFTSRGYIVPSDMPNDTVALSLLHGILGNESVLSHDLTTEQYLWKMTEHCHALAQHVYIEYRKAWNEYTKD